MQGGQNIMLFWDEPGFSLFTLLSVSPFTSKFHRPDFILLTPAGVAQKCLQVEYPSRRTGSSPTILSNSFPSPLSIAGLGLVLLAPTFTRCVRIAR